MRIPKILLLSFFLVLYLNSSAQAPKTMHAGELQLALKKLNVLGSVLYIAAHPDDENTAMLAYLANDRLIRTAYLSLTRGDGGQNLIGPEQRELMGLIRTQELLQARKIDGAEQFFTRANDFGYSKNAKEAKAIWGKDEVLADVVWVIRNFKPDVLITRFPPSRMAGHGHHEASSMLAIEAFKAAANPKKYPEQLKYVDVWQAKRIVWNAYSRKNGRFTNQAPDSLTSTPMTIGSYNPLLGKSHLVIAAESRSMHKSQGFGARKPRGGREDNLAHFQGEEAQKDIFERIDLSWDRLEGSSIIQKLLEQAYQEFKPEDPSASVPALVKAYKEMLAYKTKYPKNAYWIDIKQKELQNTIAGCLGLWLEANAAEYAVSAGDSLKIKLEAVNRCDIPVILEKVQVKSLKNGIIHTVDKLPQKLKNIELYNPDTQVQIPVSETITQPYWLVKKASKGLFQVASQQLIGKPENDPPLQAVFTVKIQDQLITYTRPITYKWTKADEGELYRHLEITPELMLNLEDKAFMFADNASKTISLTVKAGKANQKGKVGLDIPARWKVTPASQNFHLKIKGEEKTFTFQITPPQKGEEAILKGWIQPENGQKNYPKGIRHIDYLHIPIQTVFPEAEARLIRLDLKTTGKNIGYIEGAGDDIPKNLRQIGYQVTLLNPENIQEDLSKYDAIIAGVRAYNTQDWLKFSHPSLLDYVKNGGVYVVQYHTPWRMVVDNLGPYPFKPARDRVTVEEAPIRFLDKKHPLLNYPNKITAKDFEGWVQERGLYFAKEWDDHYQTVISSHDPGEKELKGGLLYTEYGEGKFIYTGYSFFRELPAGVLGAYRFFVNLISN